MNRLVIAVIGVGLIAMQSLGLAGCSRQTADPPIQAPPTVMVSYPVERTVTDYADFTGRTAAVDSVEVRARVDGYLEKTNFKEGAIVKKGDILFVIDQRSFVAQLNQARAQFGQAKAAYTQSLAQLNDAKAQANRAEAGLIYNQRRLARSEKLVPGGVITPEEFDQQKSELDQSRADLERTRAGIASAEAAIGTAKAAVESNEAAVALAELNLSYTQVTAPVTGRISRVMVTVGNLVQAGQNGGGSVLTSIVSVDPIYAYFDVDEHAALRIRMLMREGKMKGTAETEWPVSLGVGMDRGFPHQGIIDFIDNQINSKTGTLRARGVFPNQNEALTPGLFARIRVPIGAPHQAVLINERTLDNDQAQKVVYVVNEKNEVVSRPVRVGSLHAGLRAIEEGLRPGERVVVNGIQQVRPGAIVEPKLVEMPQSKSAKVAIGVRPPELNRAQSVAANRKPEIGS